MIPVYTTGFFNSSSRLNCNRIIVMVLIIITTYG